MRLITGTSGNRKNACGTLGKLKGVDRESILAFGFSTEEMGVGARDNIESMENWKERITVDPTVCHGKACILGTRITVSVILDNVAASVARDEILASYPAMTSEDVDAAFGYVAELAREGSIDLPGENRGPAIAISVHPGITIEPGKRGRKPCLRGMRITVGDVLGWLSHGMTEEEILDEHPGIEKEDFGSVYASAAEIVGMSSLHG